MAIEERFKQATHAFALICKCRNSFDLPVDIVLDLFDKLVTPVTCMLYACEVWGFEKNRSTGKFTPQIS